MPELATDFFYWVMPRHTQEWEVMQKGKGDWWYRTGMDRGMRGSQVLRVGPMIETPTSIRSKMKKERARMEQFIELALEMGFTTEQATFLWEHLAHRPHTHSTDEIVGLDEAIEEVVSEALGEEEEEDEEDE